MSQPAKYNISIKQGETWTMNFVVSDDNDVPKDLSGYSAKMQIRNKPGGELYATLQSPSSGIVVDGPNGSVTLTMSAAITGGLNFLKASYDILLTNGSGIADYPFEGDVTLNPRVTV